jgi:hypothetical protein
MAWVVPTLDGHMGVDIACIRYLKQWLSDTEIEQLLWTLSPMRRVSLVLHLEEQADRALLIKQTKGRFR